MVKGDPDFCGHTDAHGEPLLTCDSTAENADLGVRTLECHCTKCGKRIVIRRKILRTYPNKLMRRGKEK